MLFVKNECKHTYLKKLGLHGGTLLKNARVVKNRKGKICSKRLESSKQILRTCKAIITTTSEREVWKEKYFSNLWWSFCILLTFYVTNKLFIWSFPAFWRKTLFAMVPQIQISYLRRCVQNCLFFQFISMVRLYSLMFTNHFVLAFIFKQIVFLGSLWEKLITSCKSSACFQNWTSLTCKISLCYFYKSNRINCQILTHQS